MEPTSFEPKNERRREIFYGTPSIVIYRDGRPVLWVPDDFGSLTRDLSYKDLEALQRELMNTSNLSARMGGRPVIEDVMFGILGLNMVTSAA
jgi:hypothetical protein